MVTGEGLWGLEESKYNDSHREGWGRGSGELQAGQPYLNPCEGDGAIPLRNQY